MLKEMKVAGITVDPFTNTPIVLLRETTGAGRILPIFIGGSEAAAIAFALEGVQTPRPLTHDLMKNLLDAVEIVVERVS